MKKRRVFLICAVTAMIINGCGNNNENVETITQTDDIVETESEQEIDIPITNEAELRAALDAVWEEYVTNEKNNETRKAEVDGRAMSYGDVTMKYGIQVKGQPDENGYPVYIALHGGGQSDTPDINDQQWSAMATYYGTSVKNGIYINPRGVRDTWNCHFNDESFPLYDELIENLILFYDVDPNRVYLLGYSAGGDGVYAISPRMADRFAAVNMSAGHPNGVNLLNLCNVPIALQVGIYDDAFDRNKVTAEYGIKLDELQTQYGEKFFKHKTWVHLGYAHNFIDYKNSEQPVISDYVAWYENDTESEDNVDTNSVHFLQEYTRDPLPEYVIWDLSTRAPIRKNDCFYWLKASLKVNEGTIVASYDTAKNQISILQADIADDADFEILISPDMVDVFKPITIVTPLGEFEYIVEEISKDFIMSTTVERGDRNYQFVDSVSYREMIEQSK